MKHSLLAPLLFSSLFLLLTGCHNSEITEAELQKINTKLTAFEETLKSSQEEQSAKEERTLKHLSKEQQKLFSSLQSEIQELKKRQDGALLQLQVEQNQTRALIKKSGNKVQTKPLIIYKNKKEIAKLEDKLILGQEEDVIVEPFSMLMRARIDTGADTSSIDARNVEEFERDGKKWVRFTLIDRRTNTPHILEKKVLRRVNIIQSSQADSYDARLVVKLKIKIGDFSDYTEFTLTNRDHMDFAVLIGRSFLQDIAIVDVSGKDLAPVLKGAKK